MLSKKERLDIFIARLNRALPTSNSSEAIELLRTILNGVEDEHTSIPYMPQEWALDGRMYPPQEDSKRIVTNAISRYRNRNHNTYIGSNGSIKIELVIGKKVLLDKAGVDGKKVGDI